MPPSSGAAQLFADANYSGKRPAIPRTAHTDPRGRADGILHEYHHAALPAPMRLPASTGGIYVIAGRWLAMRH
jgi:hypothetical protein